MIWNALYIKKKYYNFMYYKKSMMFNIDIDENITEEINFSHNKL